MIKQVKWHGKSWIRESTCIVDVIGGAGGKGSVWLGNGGRRENLNDDTPQQQGKVTYPDTLTGPDDPQSAASSSAVSIRRELGRLTM